MIRVTPLYPEFFESVIPAHHELVRGRGDAETAQVTVRGAAGGAPWVGIARPSSEVAVLLVGAAESGSGTGIPANARREPFVVGESTVDAIAAYFPWHFFGDEWGIRVYEPAFLGFLAEIARRVKAPEESLAEAVLRQVLHHEWTHFAFEVVATELEDATGRPLYGDYSRERYGRPTSWSSGPLEELIATWAELLFARSWRPGLRGYTTAVREVNRAGPPGYRDFEVMRSQADRVVSELAGLIADHVMDTHRWGAVTPHETKQVPLHWVGNARTAAAVGLVPKSVTPPKTRELERWLRAVGAVIEPARGKGSHRSFRFNGQRGFYETSGGALTRKTATSLARFFGLAGPHGLFAHIRDGHLPPVGR
jgi:hypothetical protein